MSAQPSGEAVALVAAALRAERELVVFEERAREASGYKLPVYALRIRKCDDMTDALHAYIAELELKAAALARITRSAA